MKNFKLKNPTSPRHIVRLKPGQKLELSLSDDNTKFNVLGNFLRTTSWSKPCINGEYVRQFIIEPDYNILQYSHLSTHYLGEIVVGTNTVLMVYLESTNDSNVVSVINPFNDSIRIRPYNVIELIYASECQFNITWVWDNKEDVDLVEIDYKTSQFHLPVTKANEHYVAHYRDVFAHKEMIHHFWFRLDRGLLTLMQKNSQKDLYIGRICIEGNNGKADIDDFFVDIYCDILPKWRNKTIDAMAGQSFKISETNFCDTHRVDKHSFRKSSKIDFEFMDVKSIFEGCRIIEVKVD